jgi:hypothetical protein
MPEDEQPDISEETKSESEAQNVPVRHHSATPVEVDKEETKAVVPVEAPHVSETPIEQSVAKVNPGMLVLQWLVYAFWGWTVLAVSWLAAMVVTFLFDVDGIGDALGEPVAYALASTLVLFGISLASDIFYSKREPLHKTGATTVIMVIHAVLFALFGIGWLIAAVFGGVQLLIGEADSTNDALSLIVTAILVCVVYGVTLLRTLRPVAHTVLPRLYWIFMGIVVTALLIAAAVGPAARVRLAKADEQLEQGLPTLSAAINTYTTKEDKLPTSLDNVKSDLRGDARAIVDANKVKYTPKEKLVDTSVGARETVLDDDRSVGIAPIIQDGNSIYHYELCVTYATESDYYKDGGDIRPAIGREGYDTSPDTYSHPDGEVCYDLQTGYGYYGY